MTATLELAQALIRCPSVTPEDAGCQDIMMRRLAALGFQIEILNYGEVRNFWARYGRVQPLFVFAGHTDVVPPGPISEWRSSPFEPTRHQDDLYGRGAADMKTSLAAMITACECFLAEYLQPQGSIGFLITSDEEGPAVDGTVKVVETLSQRNEQIDYCLVGEPSSRQQLGDVIKNGRRGSLNGRLQIKGQQGHIAYPHQVLNPIHMAGPVIAALATEIWDHGNDYFPPTSLQISNIKSGTGATNVVPGALELLFNFRFSTEVTVDDLQSRTRQIVETQLMNEELRTGQVFDYELEWTLSGLPFLTQPGALMEASAAAIRQVCGIDAELSTSGGTSDGRFIAPTGAQVVELGPVNASIHQIDERVKIADIERLSAIYQRILVHLLA